MKLLYPIILAALLLSCRPQPVRYTEYAPVLIERAELEKSIRLESARPIKNAGKIYRKDNLIFINEKYEGIHVYNNVDPTNPVALGFIRIPGNMDITIKNDIIYADNAVDLVTLRYSNSIIEILDRDRNTFPEMVAPDFGVVPAEYSPENRPKNTIIVKWEKI